jgi:hypothetical protein
MTTILPVSATTCDNMLRFDNSPVAGGKVKGLTKVFRGGVW